MRKEGASADAAVAPTSEKEAIALLRGFSTQVTGPDWARSHARDFEPRLRSARNDV